MQVRERPGRHHLAGFTRPLLVAALVAMMLFLGSGAPGATPQAHADVPVNGAGVYNLDEDAYSVVEGEVLFVKVLRTDGAVLTNDVVVTVVISTGVEGYDYPLETITQLATFKKDTNPSEMTIGFQTLNQGRFQNKKLIVRILSVSAGGQLGTQHTSQVTLIGFGVPRVESISPRSGGPGTLITVQGANFQALPTRTVVDVGFLAEFASEQPWQAAGDVPGSGPPWMAATGFTVLSPTLMTVVVPDLGPAPVPAKYHLRVRVRIVGVTDEFSRSPAIAADLFTFTTGPTVTALLPSQGPATGGQLLTIRGTGFSAASCPLMSVSFGFASANMNPTACTVVSTTELRVTTPPYNPGAVDVIVCMPDQPFPNPNPDCSPPTPESRFTYTGGPVITSITPSSGPTLGGTVVSIMGTGFLNVQCAPLGPTTVRFGGLTAACTVLSSTQIIATSPPNSGVQQISVTSTTGGVSAFTTAANFTYADGPTVTSIDPADGPPQGGTVVTIKGAGFAPDAKVRFGPNLATAVYVDSTTTIRAVSPPGTGKVDVFVDVGNVLSPNTPTDDFTYSGPSITKLAPNAGPTAGGTTVTITGTNFVAGALVTFGDKPATAVAYVSPTSITAVAPAAAKAGPLDVRVTTPSGVSFISDASLFTYTDGPIVTGIDPKKGPTNGGTIVIITGTNFPAPAPAACNATVVFGTVKTDAVNCNSTTQITVLSPATDEAGVVNIRVTTPKGQSPINPADEFEYLPQPPVITNISPNTASVSGGTQITITGLGFSGVACPNGVSFGTVKAVACTVNSDTSITAIAPPNAAGPTFLGVTSPNGTNPIVQNFTYGAPTGDGGGSGGGTVTPPSKPPAGVAVSEMPPATGQGVTYTLNPRWTLVFWGGQDNVALPQALGPAIGRVTAIYMWDGQLSKWLGYFTGNGPVPGANDFTSLFRGVVYWVAIDGSSPSSLVGIDAVP